MWVDEIQRIKELLSSGKTIEEIGVDYGVSKQRIYQVMTKFGLHTKTRECRNFLRDKEPKYYWLNRLLATKGFTKDERKELLETLYVPDYCPMLGMKLTYEGTGKGCWKRTDDSPSIDKINPELEYTKDNIQIVSCRANRIKNDGSPEELMKIAEYMLSLTKK